MKPIVSYNAQKDCARLTDYQDSKDEKKKQTTLV